jgi:AraC-like DNA-binding protein
VDPRVGWALARMEQTLAEGVSVAALATAVNLSTSRFSHVFREETGFSPSEYLRRVRLEHARALLERTFLSVKEVMAAVGYRDPSHFAREFRRFHGVSARQLRQEQRRTAPADFLLAHLSAVEAGTRTSADDRQRNPPEDSRSLQQSDPQRARPRRYRTKRTK